MSDLQAIGKAAVNAKYDLALLDTETKNKVLLTAADYLIAQTAFLLEANSKDLENAVLNGMKESMLDRLRLTKERIEAMAEGLRQVAELPDPIGEVLSSSKRPNGLTLQKIRVPMGVIGIIYEARPNVTADAFALTFKSGNAVILKGGSDAIESNKSIVLVLRSAISDCNINPDALLLIEDTDRAVAREFMRMKEYVDVLIPRGGAGLIRSVVENSTIPVIETGTGNCHVYVDKDADLSMAAEIVYNAKTQRISVCNACESLVVHESILDSFLPILEQKLSEKKVELRADEKSIAYLKNAVPAKEEDFACEYLDYILSIKTVSDVWEAVRHVNANNTHHSEAIVTSNPETAEIFLNGVDAACVYWNASTRFTDGFEFGFGAEIGISTQKLHARGPMGLPELTSYKYKIYGNGQTRG